jgi:hypothetical protein
LDERFQQRIELDLDRDSVRCFCQGGKIQWNRRLSPAACNSDVFRRSEKSECKQMRKFFLQLSRFCYGAPLGVSINRGTQKQRCGDWMTALVPEPGKELIGQREFSRTFLAGREVQGRAKKIEGLGVTPTYPCDLGGDDERLRPKVLWCVIGPIAQPRA